jgi:hypothetical protein
MVKEGEVLTLESSTDSIRIVCGSKGWCQVVLVRRGAEIALGAELSDYLLKRLIPFLETPTSKQAWVLSLSERHSTLYGSRTDEGGGVVLWVQGADARMITQISLTDAERTKWLSALRGWR